MGHLLDIETWNRKEQFELYKTYTEPFFNICAEVQVGPTWDWVQKNSSSFFTACLYLSMKVANDIIPFRYRLKDGGVYVHNVIHPGSTVLNTDETFSFAYFEYKTKFSEFASGVEIELKKFRDGGKNFNPQWNSDNLIYHSVLPWIKFTGLSHPRRSEPGDSIPRIVFGKRVGNGSTAVMPVSVDVHHALMDGIHVGRYFEQLERAMLHPESMLL